MKCFGFRASVIKWFQSYLSNRKFLVCIDNAPSEAGTLKYGVPQGSILGPVLFLFYHYQTQAPICMHMTPVSSTNMRTLKKLKMF